MAEFQTFDLGRVLQTAEAIKALKRQEGDDLLRRQYLQQQISSGQQSQDMQKAQFDQQQEVEKAKQSYLQALAISRSDDPVNDARHFAPEFEKQFDSTHGTGAFANLSADQVKKLAAHGAQVSAAKAGITPKVKYIDAGGQQVAIDENTGAPVDALAPINKTAAPESALARQKFSEDQRHNRATEANAAAANTAAKAPPGYQFAGPNQLSIIPGGPAQASLANQYRDEFSKASQDFVKVGDAYTQIRNVAKQPSAAGDLSLIFSYMKMLDPGSTVREGEFANAQNAGGVGDRIVAQYNKLLRGERLSEPQRADFVSQARTVYDSAKTRHGGVEKRFRGLAQKSGIDPDLVISDSSVPEDAPAAGAPAAPLKIAGDAEFAKLPSGTIFIGPDGKKRQKP